MSDIKKLARQKHQEACCWLSLSKKSILLSIQNTLWSLCGLFRIHFIAHTQTGSKIAVTFILLFFYIIIAIEYYEHNKAMGTWRTAWIYSLWPIIALMWCVGWLIEEV